MQNTPETPRLLNTNEAAALVGFAPQTLRRFRSEGRGPKALKVQGKVLYMASNLYEWIADEAERAEQELIRVKAARDATADLANGGEG